MSKIHKQEKEKRETRKQDSIPFIRGKHHLFFLFFVINDNVHTVTSTVAIINFDLNQNQSTPKKQVLATLCLNSQQ